MGNQEQLFDILFFIFATIVGGVLGFWAFTVVNKLLKKAIEENK